MPGHGAGEVAHRVEVAAALQRSDHVQALGAGGHGVGSQAHLAQQRRHLLRGCTHCAEVVTGGIQVEHQPVGLVRAVGQGEPAVEGDHPLVGQVGEIGLGGAEHMLHGAAFAGTLQGHAPQPVREMLGALLLEEALRADAVGEALQGQGPVAQVGQHEFRHGPVVVDDLALGDAVFREQDLVQVLELQAAVADPHPGHEVASRAPRATSARLRPVFTDFGSVLTGLRRASAASSRILISSHWGLSPPSMRFRA